MTAIGLMFGELTAYHYEDNIAVDPRIDMLRHKMKVCEHTPFTKDYYDPEKRSIGNAIQIYFNDGTSTEEISIEYPIGHQRRRQEGIPVLMNKFRDSIREHFEANKAQSIIEKCEDREALLSLSADTFVSLFY